jgi:carbon-monoxide dehydrogenase large subunit
MPGVRLVLTGAETDDLGPLPCAVELPNTVLEVPPYAILARNEARHVGDAIAFVVGDTLEHAKDAAEAISVIWEDNALCTGVFNQAPKIDFTGARWRIVEKDFNDRMGG